MKKPKIKSLYNHPAANSINWVLQSLLDDPQHWKKLHSEHVKVPDAVWAKIGKDVEKAGNWRVWAAVHSELVIASGGDPKAEYRARAAVLALLAYKEADEMLKTGTWIPNTPASELMLVACMVQANEEMRPYNEDLYKASMACKSDLGMRDSVLVNLQAELAEVKADRDMIKNLIKNEHSEQSQTGTTQEVCRLIHNRLKTLTEKNAWPCQETLEEIALLNKVSSEISTLVSQKASLSRRLQAAKDDSEDTIKSLVADVRECQAGLTQIKNEKRTLQTILESTQLQMNKTICSLRAENYELQETLDQAEKQLTMLQDSEHVCENGSVMRLKERIAELEKACKIKDATIIWHKEARKNLLSKLQQLEAKLAEPRDSEDADNYRQIIQLYTKQLDKLLAVIVRLRTTIAQLKAEKAP